MYLDEFFAYKNQLAEDLLTEENIVRLLDDDATATDGERLMYTQVFPYEFVPETVEHGRTFICCDVDITRVENKTFLSPVLYVWIFTHKSLLRLPEGGVRIDRLAHEIAKKIDGSRNYGLGVLNLYSVKRFAPMMDYQGKVLVFHARDFNTLAPTGKSIPANRKMG